VRNCANGSADAEAFELKDGDILGHECAGVVEKVGPGESAELVLGAARY